MCLPPLPIGRGRRRFAGESNLQLADRSPGRMSTWLGSARSSRGNAQQRRTGRQFSAMKKRRAFMIVLQKFTTKHDQYVLVMPRPTKLTPSTRQAAGDDRAAAGRARGAAENEGR
jgi:hypothetical protein